MANLEEDHRKLGHIYLDDTNFLKLENEILTNTHVLQLYQNILPSETRETITLNQIMFDILRNLQKGNFTMNMSYLIKPFDISKLHKERDLNDLINRITLSREKSIVLMESDRRILYNFLIYCVEKEDPKILPTDEGLSLIHI